MIQSYTKCLYDLQILVLMFLYVLCMNLQKYMSILSVNLAFIVQALISLELDKNNNFTNLTGY